jgi:3-deoxy-manno-octulosonate cytidylyltransferase (CMP-KDO synthetase)
MSKNLIIIPARYASTRLPAKPLVQIAGKTMLSRVVDIARIAATQSNGTSIIVATDHEDIAAHCEELGVDYVMTDPNCPSGTDRCAAALNQINHNPQFVVNLQGDTPLTPPDFISDLIKAYHANPADVMTPITRLSWVELDKMRTQKAGTPFSGTLVAFNQTTMQALWFSKNIIPAIRGEEKLRGSSDLSPVWRHIGIYGYETETLMEYTKLAEGYYEKLEGLEQLRLLENGAIIRCVAVDYAGRPSMSGVDSPEDVVRAEQLIALKN